MTTHPTTDLIIDYVHGELPPDVDSGVHAHLATCPSCRAEYDAEVALGETLRAAAAAEEREFPSLVAANVWQEIRNARPGPFARLTAALRPAFAVPVFAALALGTFLASPALQHAGARPSIDAAYYFADHAAQEAANPFAEHPLPAQSIETSALQVDTTVEPPLAQAASSGDVEFAAANSDSDR